jgi:hypothetical protein
MAAMMNSGNYDGTATYATGMYTLRAVTVTLTGGDTSDWSTASVSFSGGYPIPAHVLLPQPEAKPKAKYRFPCRNPRHSERRVMPYAKGRREMCAAYARTAC